MRCPTSFSGTTTFLALAATKVVAEQTKGVGLGQSRWVADHPSLRQLVLVRVEWEDADTYRVVFLDRADGAMVEASCQLQTYRGKGVATLEPNLFGRWMGDAESIRSVVSAVYAVDRARRLSLRDYDI